MKKIIEKAAVLVEALPYIQRFRDKIIVIKYGGSTMSSGTAIDSVLTDIVFMECVGMKPVIIHGGGRVISDKMRTLGKVPKFVQGLRVTDEETIRLVEETLVNEVGKDIEKTIEACGGMAKAISGRYQGVLKARKHFVRHKNPDGTEEMLDIGFVGDVCGVGKKPILDLCAQGIIPVISPVAEGEDGMCYNINADVAAGHVAGALKAQKLVYLTDVPGVLGTEADHESLISHLSIEKAKELINKGIISSGMIPKVKSCVNALELGVDKAHIIDGRVQHSLLLEIFTDKGIGTEIAAE